MSTKVSMPTIPDCDICKSQGVSVKAFADATSGRGPTSANVTFKSIIADSEPATASA